MLSPDILRDYVIRETLEYLGDLSSSAINLLLGTAAQESHLGKNMKSGRLFGLYQISPTSHRAVWDKYLIHEPEMASQVRGLAGQHSFLKDPNNELIGNMKYATAIAWAMYKRHTSDLPDADDVKGLAECWYKYYPHHGIDYSSRNFVVSYYQLVHHLPVPVAA